MLAFIGDLHGAFSVIPHLVKDLPHDATVIQVGDLGIWPQTKHQWMKIGHLDKPMYFIDGNHEFFPWLVDIKEPTEFWPGLIYLPRGSILTIDGKRIGFMGGGASVDKIHRRSGYTWFAAEEIAQDEFERLYLDKGPLDMLVTHTPPNCIVEKHFDRMFLLQYKLPITWVDPSAVMVEKIWEKHGRPPLVCGHMHRRLVDGTVTILNVNDVWSPEDGFFTDPHEAEPVIPEPPAYPAMDPRNSPIST